MKIDFNNNWTYRLDGEQAAVSVCLPHDAMIDSPRSKQAQGGGANAYFDGGIYVYEKQFDVPKEWKDKTVTFEFEGVYRHAKVYLNGKLAKEWAYGYTGFYVDANPFLKYGENNSVKVVADNSNTPNSRWYTGGGIYRPVHLIVKNKTHFNLDGITVSTVSVNPAILNVDAQSNGGEASFEILFNGKSVATCGVGRVEIPNAQLWSDKTPNLYTLKAVLKQNGDIVDEEEITFGIRKLESSPKGLFVNGEETLLRGGCVHHDNGILGARCYAEAEDRKVRIIKQAGFNAIRSSHNPCSKAFCDACDKYGVYLVDETFDMWQMRKKKFDYALDFEQWHLADIDAVVQKDKNHPSVIMYSIGNEVADPCNDKGVALAKEMVEFIHKLDSTRPVTAGVNLMIIQNAAKGKGVYSEAKVEAETNAKQKKEKPVSSTLFNMIAVMVGSSMNKMVKGDKTDAICTPYIDLLDIAGYNYGSGRYPIEGTKHPSRIIFGSETFPQDIYKNWQAVKKYPYLLGDFMWTALDYLGEVGIGGWSYDSQLGFNFEKPYPWIIADTGAIDIIGTVGAEAQYAATVWGLNDKPYIGVRPVSHPHKRLVKSVWRGTNAVDSWAWKGCEGNKAIVEVYSDAAFVELYLNGKKLGRKKVNECKATFTTKYASGTLTAVALDSSGKEISRTELKSASDVHINVSCEQKLKAGEIAFIEVSLVDGNGIVESNADCELVAEVKGGTILAFGSAQQKTEEKYSSNKTQTYYGRALLVVKAESDLQVVVKGEGLQESTLNIDL